MFERLSPLATRLTLGVAALAVVGGSIAGVTAVTSDADAKIDQTGYAPAFTLTGVVPGAPVLTVDDGVSAPAAAHTVTDAVARFFAAEITGDTATSFAQLSAADREAVGSLENWDVAADLRPGYLAYRVLGVSTGRVVLDVDITPRVSEVDGVTPSSATIELDVVAEDGGFRISLANSTFVPIYPNPELADSVAMQWVNAARECDDAARSALEYDGNLLGTLGLVERLCRAAGTATVAASGSLDALVDPSSILNAFGEAAAEWSRVVSVEGVSGVAPLHVVLAPLGERWVVIGGLSG
jgi:hypothetical protein